MILRRLGNKRQIAKKIKAHFPSHNIYIEPFFGAGGMFFSKPKAKWNVLNDLDEDVLNLFNVVCNHPEELKSRFYQMPISEALWKHWKINKETDCVMRAVRFLFLSNYGFMGKPETLRFLNGNASKLIIDKIIPTHDMLLGCEFTGVDFRELFKKLPITNTDKTFVYCDPPYLDTGNNYSDGFTWQDASDLFEVLVGTGFKFAISEFDHPEILRLADLHELEVITIGERRNLANRRTEILVVNYRSDARYGLFSVAQLVE
ncbi:MAG: DNA adenine methylase [Bacteroidota bacterium]